MEHQNSVDSTIVALEARIAQLEQKLTQLQTQLNRPLGPTANYVPLNQSYSGTNIMDGILSAGAGPGGGSLGQGLGGGSYIEVRRRSDGLLLLWVGSSVVASNILHEGMHIPALDVYSGSAVTAGNVIAACQAVVNALTA